MTYTTTNPLKLSEVPGFRELIITLKDSINLKTGQRWDENEEPGHISFLHLDEIREIDKDEKGKYIIYRERDDEHDGTPLTKAYIIDYWIQSARGRWCTGVEFLNL